MTVHSFKFLLFILLLVASSQGHARCEQEQFSATEAKRLFEAKQYLLSSVHFSILRGGVCDKQLSSRAWLGYALALSHLSENQEALTVIEKALSENDVSERDKSALRMNKAWISDDASPLTTVDQKNRWALWKKRTSENFQTDLKTIGYLPAQAEQISNLQTELLKVPQKSVVGSALASAVLPGLGQAYLGQWQASALSLVLNTLFLGSTIEFSRKGMTFPAIASGTIFSITYVGNILSAANGASEINRARRDAVESQLRVVILPELTF